LQVERISRHRFSARPDRFTLLLALDDNPARRNFGSCRTARLSAPKSVVLQEQIVNPGFPQDEAMPISMRTTRGSEESFGFGGTFVDPGNAIDEGPKGRQ